MEEYKITRIYLENFKFVDRAVINISDADLVVLDGPNGFGKTTIFDAIELVLTGKIERIESYNKKEGYNTLLFSKDEKKDTIIKLELCSDKGASIILCKWPYPC